MLVDWNPFARASLWAILDFIGERNVSAAQDLYDAIEAATEGLPQHPYLYRPGRVAGTREIVVHPNYIAVYRVTSQIEILNVLHARQQYPKS